MVTSTTERGSRLLIVADEACGPVALPDLVREHAGGDGAEVLIVAPALTSRLRYWMSDEDAGIAAAGRRLAEWVDRCDAEGVPATGALGDADPLQAIDDAIRSFHPDQVLIATPPIREANWLEHGLVEQARQRSTLPVVHVEIDGARGVARVQDAEIPERTAPARERHTRRDLGFLLVAWILAIGGSALSALLYAAGVGGWVLGTWVVVFDLGLKLALAAVVWTLFQRRPRADRIDL